MKKNQLFRDDRGFIMVLVAGCLIVFCGLFAGLAIDVGNAYMVRGQLQIAADATALAGAGDLYIKTTTPPTVAPWAIAETTATNFIGKNKADGKALTNCEPYAGYWNINLPPTQELKKTISKTGACSITGAACSIDSECPATEGCLQIWVPAIKVTVSKSSGNSNGPVKTFFAKVMGWDQFEPSAAAVALSGFPGASPPGAAFPFAVTQCLKDDFLNGVAGATGDIPLAGMYTTSAGVTMPRGQWTSLAPDGNYASLIKNYIDYLNDPGDSNASASPSVKTGEVINIVPGDKAVLFIETKKLIDDNKGLVYMPVVQCNIVLGSPMTVMGFAGVQLSAANPPNTLVGRFTDFYPAIPGSGPGGEISNTLIPPKLVR